MSRLLLSLLLFSLVTTAEALTEFAADIAYYKDQSRTASGRIFVANHAVREERRDQNGEEIRITDLYQGVMYVLNPQTGEYHQQQAFPVPRDPLLFCEEMALLECGFQQEEDLLGSRTERWGAELGFGDFSLGVVAWYDPEIQYPVRIELKDGPTQQLSNIQRGRLRSSLFSIPFHYREVESEEVGVLENFPVWP